MLHLFYLPLLSKLRNPSLLRREGSHLPQADGWVNFFSLFTFAMSLHLLTIQNWLQHHSTYRGDHLAIVSENKRLTYRQLHEEVSMLANAFTQAGICKGDKVATLLHNTLELYETYWACAAIGAVAVPLSPLLRGQGLFNLLDNADTKLVITCSELIEHVDQIKKTLKFLLPIFG